MKNNYYFEISFTRNEVLDKVQFCKFDNLETAIRYCKFVLKFFDFDVISIKAISLE